MNNYDYKRDRKIRGGKAFECRYSSRYFIRKDGFDTHVQPGAGISGFIYK